MSVLTWDNPGEMSIWVDLFARCTSNGSGVAKNCEYCDAAIMAMRERLKEKPTIIPANVLEMPRVGG